jgi:hypothetical protein
MYMRLILLDRLKDIQLIHYYVSLVIVRLKLLLKNWKGVNQILVNFSNSGRNGTSRK